MGSAVASGAVADIVCNPMFIVRTRLQTEALHGGHEHTMISTTKALYAEGGILVFWRGMTANLLGLSHVAIQFPAYEFLKQHAWFRNDPNSSSVSSSGILMASALSKMTASMISYPHEVVRSRMMDSRSRPKFIETCQHIYAREGWMGFYSGLPVSMIRVLPNTCMTFLTYELFCEWSRVQLKEYRRQKHH